MEYVCFLGKTPEIYSSMTPVMRINVVNPATAYSFVVVYYI